MASSPETMERPTAKKRQGPTIAALAAKVERARHGNDGPDIGAMSSAERKKYLLGG